MQKSLHSDDVAREANCIEIDVLWGIGTYDLIQNIYAY